MTDNSDMNKPLHYYEAHSRIPFPFPIDWLACLASQKALLWSVSYGYITETQFMSGIAISVTGKAEGLHGFMIVTPKPRNINGYADQYPKEVISAVGKHMIAYKVNSPDKFPSQSMMEITGKTMNNGHILLGFVEKQLDIQHLAASNEKLDIFALMELSKYFVYFDLDGFMLIGLVKEVEGIDIPDEILSLIKT